MNPVETYLRELRDIRSSGAAVKETSYYGPLANLLNEVGKHLKPRVRCIINIQNRGAGIPDGGLFTADQFQRSTEGNPQPGTLPARGVIEVKGTGEDAWITADGPQVTKYWGKYGQVLVTNYRDFVLVGHDANGQPVKRETYRLAEGEAAFWAAAADPHKMTEAHGQSLLEYLQRVMLHAAPLASPEDVAWFLASYAREAKSRIEHAAEMNLPALNAVRAALEQALGLTFQEERGDHFFRSTLIQTLFYGVFSAWVLWSKRVPREDTQARFHWREAHWELHVPMIRALFEQLAMPSKLKPLRLEEVLDWTGAALNRVDRAAFFEKFEESHAVQYFYEPFLQAYDPELRKELGVWYTPPEIVQYMVARVDTALREELNIADGLADPRVYVLDPCCGTGAYCVEVLRHIATTLQEQGEDALLAAKIKRAAKERVFGFEILPAPFVVSHLQIGLLLQNLGAPLAEAQDERAAVYLTNALTGWEPPKHPKQQLVFPEMEEEREAAERIKQQTPILVILGNPPYNGFAGVAVSEERELSNAYRTTKNAPAPQGQGLNDLYVRFYRMAERRIVEQTGKGIVCFISNYSWLDGLSFTGMREHYIEAFDTIRIDCLNGDKYKTGKLTPEGQPDPSVFSTEFNREGIQVGTAIALLVRKEEHQPASESQSEKSAGLTGRALNYPSDPHPLAPSPSLPASRRERGNKRNEDNRPADGNARMPMEVPSIRTGTEVEFRHLWGKTKRAQLLDTLPYDRRTLYEEITPILSLGLPIMPIHSNAYYLDWPLLPELLPALFPGVQTKRDELVVDIDHDRLLKRMKQYFDPNITDEQMKRICARAMETTARFDAAPVREYLVKRGMLPEYFVPYLYRPFDIRWIYWEPETRLLGEKVSAYFPHVFEGNVWIVSQQKPRREWSMPQFTRHLGCLDVMDRGASFIPLYLRENKGTKSLFDGHELQDARLQDGGRWLNISDAAMQYLNSIGTLEDAESLFYHALSVLHTPMYRTENSGALRQDWPRIPLPDSLDLLKASAALGRQVAALFDTEKPVPGVTTTPIRPEIKAIGAITRVGGGSLDPATDDLAITAGWGHAGSGGVTMPAKGRWVERDYTPEEKAAMGVGIVASSGADPVLCAFGEKTFDVYLNDVAYWRNIPERVWGYTIGGYQVIKKWLSYRERTLLGRALTEEEVTEVTQTARRITALLLLEAALDANYTAVKSATSR